MQIEKLDENKIKITLNLQDLQEKNVDLHTFLSNSIESQDLFYDMLDQAEKEIGFKTNNYKLIIEALALPTGNFILTITRFAPEGKNIKINAKRKNIALKSNLYAYKFSSFDDYLDFCNYIQQSSNKDISDALNQSTLYKYNSIYYLYFKLNTFNLNTFKSIHCSIIEFGYPVSNSDFLERKLIEHGNVIFKSNAINSCIKAFS